MAELEQPLSSEDIAKAKRQKQTQLRAYLKSSLQHLEQALLPAFHAKSLQLFSQNALISNQLPKEIIHEISDRSEGSKHTGLAGNAIWVAPLRFIRNDNAAKAVHPVWLRVAVDISGALTLDKTFAYPWVPKALLEPASQHEFVLGERVDFEQFFCLHPLPWRKQPKKAAWEDIITYATTLVEYIAGGSLESILSQKGYEVDTQAALFVIAKDQKPQQAYQIIYDQLDESIEAAPLAKLATSVDAYIPRAPMTADEHKALRLDMRAHLDHEVALLASERHLLDELLSVEAGEIQAVTSPSGTGKRPLTQNLLSTVWVQSALNKEQPALTVLTSHDERTLSDLETTYNQAWQTEQDLALRWLPGCEGITLSLTSTPKKSLSAHIKKIDQKYYDDASQAYLSQASSYFKNDFKDIAEVKNFLYERIQWLARAQSEGLSLARAVTNVTEALEQEYKRHGGFQARFDQLYSERQTHLKLAKQWQVVHNDWETYIQAESAWSKYMSWLPGVAQKRLARDKAFLKTILGDEAPRANSHQALVAAMAERWREVKREYAGINRAFTALQSDWDRLGKAMEAWGHWKNEQFSAHGDLNHLAQIDVAIDKTEKPLYEFLDTRLRHTLFLYTMHYWEARWLEATSTLLDAGEKIDPEQESTLRHAAMLTPVIITSPEQIPAHFQQSRTPSWQVIDHLVIEDAEQLMPAIGVALFALAKRAYVMGDPGRFIAAQRTIAEQDHGQITLHKLTESDEDHEDLEYRGLLTSSGNVFDLAVFYSAIQTQLEDGFTWVPSLVLDDQVRSRASIVQLAQSLTYANIVPGREETQPGLYPALGLHHVKGESSYAQGSRQNVPEAEAIAIWLKEEMGALLDHYPGQSVTDLVAIVTPFASQVAAIKQALKQKRIKVKQIGTLEEIIDTPKPIVLFSPVYSPDDVRPYMYDRDVNYFASLVSIAQDAFVVIGDATLWHANERTPSGIVMKSILDVADGKRVTALTLPSVTIEGS